MSEWKEYRLSDIAEIHDSKRIPLNSRDRSSMKGNFPYYGASGIVDYINDYIFYGEYVLISEDGENLRSRQTPIAFKVNGKFWVNNHAHILKGSDELINNFIVYYFRNLNISPYITGAVQPKLNMDNLLSIPIFMPENRAERVSITRTLLSLDNKIDLLRRQNETLEAIAQTLFKRWFVEFEFPDENGQPYKSSGGKMVSSELGEIPEGWRAGKIGNICSILNEVIKPNAKEKELYFHYSIPAFDDGYSPKKECGKDILSNKFCVKSNTILVSKLNPRKPRIWPILEIDEKKSISSTEFQVIKPIKKSYYCFIFNMFKSRYIRKEMAQRATGTSGSHQRMRPDDILDIDVVISKENLILDFKNVAKKMIEKIDSNLKTIQTLSQTRNILLPKLMSGQIRVK